MTSNDPMTSPGAPTTPDEVEASEGVRVEMDDNGKEPATVRIWNDGVLVFDGIAKSALLTAAEQKGRGEEGLREATKAVARVSGCIHCEGTGDGAVGYDADMNPILGPCDVCTPIAKAALLAASEADRAEGEGHDGHAARLNGLLADCPGCAPATPPTADAEGLSETVIRIGSYVEAGTACTHCRATYWLCSDRVLREPRDPKAWDGCCDQCRDASGHVTRILPGVEGLIAEAVAAAAAPDAGGGAK